MCDDTSEWYRKIPITLLRVFLFINAFSEFRTVHCVLCKALCDVRYCTVYCALSGQGVQYGSRTKATRTRVRRTITSPKCVTQRSWIATGPRVKIFAMPVQLTTAVPTSMLHHPRLRSHGVPRSERLIAATFGGDPFRDLGSSSVSGLEKILPRILAAESSQFRYKRTNKVTYHFSSVGRSVISRVERRKRSHRHLRTLR